ncbi:type I restriction-modification system subunit M [Campylobacter upsaliensis]|nr:type I restriction-modification system subunit M [Campylobacter upsaliensis]
MPQAPLTRQAQRDALHSTIWKVANKLRGNVDGWDFKMYVLGMLFYRFISENLAAYINAKQGISPATMQTEGDNPNAYENLSDKDIDENEKSREAIIDAKGFFIYPSQLFCNVLKSHAHDTTNLNQTLSNTFESIEASTIGTQSETKFKGLFSDIDVNSSNKLGETLLKRNEKLYQVMQEIATLDLHYSDNAIDTFGDAYEYLMRMYADKAGKSGGEFFTPQEVSYLLARLVSYGKQSVNKVYDPACGSGSLLLQFAKVLGIDNIKQGFFGQEINPTSYNLCRINMLLHDIGFENFDIALGDTLLEPKHADDEPFDAIVSNPPYSTKWIGDDDPKLINDPRFAPAGVLAPKSYADLAFTMHMLSWLSPSGTCAIVEFPGVLYRGGKEKQIRKYLINQNFIDTIIQLPENLFFGTNIATSIIVLKKNKQSVATLFIDASEQFTKITKKNILESTHINTIVEAYAKREDIEHFSRLVSLEEIRANDYNLSTSTYITPKDTREHIDIAVLNATIKDIVTRQTHLRQKLDSIITSLGE